MAIKYDAILSKLRELDSGSGETGPQGPAGADGADGQGVPTGGTAGYILAKASGTDFDTEWVEPSSGVTDHGALTGLADDDHTQYHTDARGDARYSQLGHGHAISDVTGLQTALDGKAASTHTHAISDVTNLQTTLDGKAASSHTHASTAITDFAEAVSDQVGTMLTGNTETLITVTYQDSDNTIDFAVDSDLANYSWANVDATDLKVGSITQAWSANLDEYAAVNPTTAGLALLDDVDNAAQRTTLGLGTLATQNGTFSGTSSGTNTGDQTITLTGDVTGSGTGSFAATIANGAVDIAMLSATGTPDSTTFLRGDNTWAAPSGSGGLTAAQVASLISIRF